MGESELCAYWERTQQTEVCGDCEIDVVVPVEERMTLLCGDGWELHGGMVRLGGLGQTDSVDQQEPAGELVDMRSQLELAVVDSVDETTDAGDGAVQRADRRTQTGADDQAARVPATGAWV